MAPFYDGFTAGHDYDAWTRTLEDLAVRHGLRGKRLLDLGCGTGKSFLPFVERGYDVTASDISPRMADVAARKAPSVPVHVLDVRRLPRLGAFDLVLCLDDCLNHLLADDALHQGLRGIADNLAPDGVAVFDVNTIATYRGFFASDHVSETAEHMLVWSGRTPQPAQAGVLATAVFCGYAHAGDDRWRRTRVEHAQRHHPEPAVRSAIAAAGLDCVAVYGHGLDGSPHAGVDELSDTKAVYLARHAR